MPNVSTRITVGACGFRVTLTVVRPANLVRMLLRLRGRHLLRFCDFLRSNPIRKKYAFRDGV